MFSNKKEQQVNDNHSSNIIGKGTVVKGDIHTIGNIRIEGKVVGNITTEAKLVVGDTASIEGDITAQNCEIGGNMAGTIHIKDVLIVRSTAVVEGNMVTAKLVFEEGAHFNGKCEMYKPTQEAKGTSIRSQQTIPPTLTKEK